ncbi:MAG TPA: kelch repeat-containing protein, partial [Tepidisphaeraceae bacterium]|nr:kelch repeat-containing protein [Tepidisphaeraceae bacterium]
MPLVLVCCVGPLSAQYVPFDIADITWTLGPDHPTYRKGGALGFVGGMVVSAAGVEYPWAESSETYGYAPGAAGWVALPSMPMGVAYTDGITVGDSMYVVGGRTGVVNTRSEVFRLRKIGGSYVWDQQPSLSLTRAYHTLALNGTRIIAGPGARFTNNNPPDWWDRMTTDVDSFDTANPGAGWSLIPSISGVPRIHPVTAAAGGRIYVFGGTNFGAPGSGYDTDRLNDAWVLQPGASSWTRLPDLPFGFAGGDAVTYRDRYIIMLGGVTEIS